MKKDKQKALELIKQKNNGEIKITYQEIANKGNYSLSQIKMLSKEIDKLFRERDERLKARAKQS